MVGVEVQLVGLEEDQEVEAGLPTEEDAPLVSPRMIGFTSTWT